MTRHSKATKHPEATADEINKNFLFYSTAILLIATPGFVAAEPLFSIPENFWGDMFCGLLANRYLLFAMAKVSILLVTFLAVERWYCVMRPIEYKIHFGRKRRILYIVVSWLISCTLQVHKIFDKELVGDECVTVEAPYGEQGSQAFIAIYSFTNFMIPCLVTWFTFTHIKFRMPDAPNATQHNKHRKIQQKMVLRLCALTAAVLNLCWLPAQVSYTLSPSGITDIKSTLHQSWHVIAFLNSCLNPLIYWYFHKEYKREFMKLFCRCKMPHFIAPSAARSVPYHIGTNYVHNARSSNSTKGHIYTTPTSLQGPGI